MNINTPRDPLLGSDFRSESGDFQSDLTVWLGSFKVAVEDVLKRVYKDVVGGRSKYKVFTSEPSVTDLQDGQIGFYGEYMYTKYENTLRRTKMDEVKSRNLVCRVTVTS